MFCSARILIVKSNFCWPFKNLKKVERRLSKPLAMEVAERIDHFARIPEELVVSILSRLENLKHIFGCSIVSKRFASSINQVFASSINQVKSVSLTLPSTERPPPEFVDNIVELFPKLAALTVEEILRFIQSSSLKEFKFFPFLQNFRELRSISLEFTCTRAICTSSLFFIRVLFTSERAIIQKYVSFVPESVYKDTQEGYDDEEPSYNGDQLISGTFLPYGCCTNWLLALCLLVKCHPFLENITITNSKKQGTLVLKGEEIVAWRNSFVPGGFFNDFTPYSRTFGLISELHMPNVGFMMNEVGYVIARFVNVKRSDYRALSWEYMGDDKLFENALCEFIRRYGDALIMTELSGWFLLN